MSFVPDFPVGSIVTNQQISAAFRCGNMGGMRRSHATNTLVIISDYTKSIYDDKWFGNELHYTGMGKIGDQLLDKQNRTLAESGTNGVSVHLFEVFEAMQYTYHGVVRLSGEPYQEIQPDVEGNLRKVWMFPVRTVQENISVNNDALAARGIAQERKAKKFTIEELKKHAERRSSEQAAHRTMTTKTFVRDAYIAEYAKRRAEGHCQLCHQPAPFKDSSGEPYLEAHHIVWLSEGGADSIENTVALCPNCHRKMHVLKDPSDIEQLKKK